MHQEKFARFVQFEILEVSRLMGNLSKKPMFCYQSTDDYSKITSIRIKLIILNSRGIVVTEKKETA